MKFIVILSVLFATALALSEYGHPIPLNPTTTSLIGSGLVGKNKCKISDECIHPCHEACVKIDFAWCMFGACFCGLLPDSP